MIPEEIFVDTGAWVALADKDDFHHKQAVSLFPSLLKTKRSLVTSNLVIAETYIILLKELGHRAAMSFLERLKASPRIKKVYSDENIEEEAEGILRKYSDQDFSYADVVSFVMMRRHRIKTAFCFDSHFSTFSFIVIP
jgi:uncharacterized protein